MEPLPQSLLREELAKRYGKFSAEAISAAAERSGGFLGQAKRLLEEDGQVRAETAALVEALCRKSNLGLVQLLVPLEKSKRDVLAELLQDWQGLLENAITAACGEGTVSDQARRLAAALDVDFQDQIAAIVQFVGDHAFESAIAVLMHMRPFIEGVLRNQLVKLFVGDEMIAHAVHLAVAGLTGGAAHRDVHVGVLFQKTLHDHGFAGSGRSGNDKQ